MNVKNMNVDVQEKVKEILSEVNKNGETYLVSLTSDQLRTIGFQPTNGEDKDDFFDSFRYVDIKILKTNEEYVIKYVFDGGDVYYEYENQLKGYFYQFLESILEVGGRKLYFSGQDKTILCDLTKNKISHPPHLMGEYSTRWGKLNDFCVGYKYGIVVCRKNGNPERPDEAEIIVYQ